MVDFFFDDRCNAFLAFLHHAAFAGFQGAVCALYCFVSNRFCGCDCFFCDGCQRKCHHCFDGVAFLCVLQIEFGVNGVRQILQQLTYGFLIGGNHSGCAIHIDDYRLHRFGFAVSRCCSAADYQYKYYDSKYSKMCFHCYLLERAVLPFLWDGRGFRFL